ncbi:MAG TPA: GspH/FimT family protein [Cellvibrio sp.]|nr:GspH/FimT family protein [Cellvibrio sp.]
MHLQGFTLLELLIVLIIMILLLALGIPGLSTHIENTQVSTASSSLTEAIALTRSQAVISNTRTTLKNLGSWNRGWEIFIDFDNNGMRGEHEKLIATHPQLNNVRITPNQPVRHYLSFIGSGESRFAGRTGEGAFQAGTLYICPTGRGRGYALILARGGRLRIQEINADQCAAGPT